MVGKKNTNEGIQSKTTKTTRSISSTNALEAFEMKTWKQKLGILLYFNETEREA